MSQHLHLLARMRRNPITPEKVQTVYRKSTNMKQCTNHWTCQQKVRNQPTDVNLAEKQKEKDASHVTESQLGTKSPARRTSHWKWKDVKLHI